MLENASTVGSIDTSFAQKKKYANESMEFNSKNALFRKLFPQLIKDLPFPERNSKAVLDNQAPKRISSSTSILRDKAIIITIVVIVLAFTLVFNMIL